MNKLPRQRKRKRGEKGIHEAASNSNAALPCDIEIEPKNNKLPSYDSCNVLALPSKKIKLAHKKKNLQQARPFLSKRKRKELEKIVATKEKKKNRSSLLDALSSVQVAPELGNIFSSIVKHKKDGPPKKPKPAKGKYDDDSMEDLEIVSKVVTQSLYSIPKPSLIPISKDSSDDEEKDIPQQKIMNIIPNGNSSKLKAPVSRKAKKDPSVFVPVHRPAHIQEARMKLPILAEEQAIMETIKENPVTVLAGETGSGKTTQVPQFLYEGGYASKGKMIGVTEPRRVAAISMSVRVAEEMNLSSKEVSYLIRFEGNATPSTKILFMTDGVLLREARNDLMLTKYSVIIVDEAHERSVFTDILIGLLSRVVRLRKEKGDPLKLIIMSATLRLTDFTENTRLFKTPPPVIKVDSRQFPVTIHFARRTDDDYVSEAYKKVCKIHTELPDGGILVFVTGQKEVKFLVQKLRKSFPVQQVDNQAETQEDEPMIEEEEEEDEPAKEFDEIGKKSKKRKKKKKGLELKVVNLDSFAETVPEDELAEEIEDDEEIAISDYTLPAIRQPMWVLPLFSLLSSHKQGLVFKPPPAGMRLCVVATNIAETSLTIPGVKYVVDSGRTKHRKCDKITGVSTFEVDWTSKASADQRTGRAGRVGPGHCYRLFSSAVFNDKFLQFSIPDILQRPVDDLFLQMKSMGIDKVVNFPYPSPPSIDQLKAAEIKLTLLGALEPLTSKKSPGSLTPLGRAISGFPVTPRFGKMLALCIQHKDLMPHAVSLVAALSVEQLLLDPGKAVKECALNGQTRDLGDPAVVMRLIYAAKKCNEQGEESLKEFCDKHSLRMKGVKEVWKLQAQLTSEINISHPEINLSIDPSLRPPSDSQCRLLRQILLAGSVDQVAQKVNELEIKDQKSKWKLAYRTGKLEEPVFMSAISVLKKSKPQWVIYQDLFETTKVIMRGVTAIEPEWLPTYAPSLCKLSPPLAEPPSHYDPRSQRLMCWVTGTFGENDWELPRMEIDIPPGIDRYKHLARFFMEGAVFPNLAQFKHILVKNPASLISTSTSTKGTPLVNQLILKQADDKDKIINIWKDDPKYLLSSYKLWLPESAHSQVEIMWPPL